MEVLKQVKINFNESLRAIEKNNEESRKADERRYNKLFILTIIVIVAFFGYICINEYYKNQYDYVTESSYELDTEDGGNAVINEGGDVTIE